LPLLLVQAQLFKDITIITTHTSKLLLIQLQLKPPLMPVLMLLKLPLKPRKPLRRKCQQLRMLRLKPLLSLSQRLPTNQLKLKEPGLKLELMMPLKLPQLLTTMLLEKLSSLICINQEHKIN
jgi:hypothetical protein